MDDVGLSRRLRRSHQRCQSQQRGRSRRPKRAARTRLGTLSLIPRPELDSATKGKLSMKYRKLGRTGFEVSEIGHGLWGMGGWSDKSDAESLAALHTSISLGCTFFDSAWAYGDGHSDTLLGRALRDADAKQMSGGRPLYAASKVPPKNRKWPGSSADKLRDVFPRDHVIAHAEKIRSALGRGANGE